MRWRIPILRNQRRCLSGWQNEKLRERIVLHVMLSISFCTCGVGTRHQDPDSGPASFVLFLKFERQGEKESLPRVVTNTDPQEHGLRAGGRQAGR